MVVQERSIPSCGTHSLESCVEPPHSKLARQDFPHPFRQHVVDLRFAEGDADFVAAVGVFLFDWDVPRAAVTVARGPDAIDLRDALSAELVLDERLGREVQKLYVSQVQRTEHAWSTFLDTT